MNNTELAENVLEFLCFFLLEWIEQDFLLQGATAMHLRVDQTPTAITATSGPDFELCLGISVGFRAARDE